MLQTELTGTRILVILTQAHPILNKKVQINLRFRNHSGRLKLYYIACHSYQCKETCLRDERTIYTNIQMVSLYHVHFHKVLRRNEFKNLMCYKVAGEQHTEVDDVFN